MSEDNKKIMHRGAEVRQIPPSVFENLGPRARQIAEYWIEHPETNMSGCARALGISPSRVSQIIRSNRYLTALKKAVQNNLGLDVPLAYTAFRECVTQKKNFAVKQKASERMLEEQGVFGAQKIEITNKFEGLSTEELKKIAAKAALRTGEIVDAEVVEDQ
jgi:DNA-binding transcriptional regulator YdaS (Cro superfamily)